LYSFRERKPRIHAWSQVRILARRSSRSSSIWPRTPARKKTCDGYLMVSSHTALGTYSASPCAVWTDRSPGIKYYVHYIH
jgi:hypothetical protein